MDDEPGVSAAWERRAAEWVAWVRTPGTDVFFDELNWPQFDQLLPPAGRRTVEIGCGEGRIGRLLAAAGHRVAGIDSSPTLASLARDGGGFEEVVCASAVSLPWSAGSFDLAVAFMSLQDMDDPVGAIDEIARVLEPGGVFCLATVHPLNRSTASLDDYFAERRVATTAEHNGVRMTFEAIDRPLDTYTRALAAAGFVIEHLHEPRPRGPREPESRLAIALTRPFLIHIRCRLERPR